MMTHVPRPSVALLEKTLAFMWIYWMSYVPEVCVYGMKLHGSIQRDVLFRAVIFVLPRSVKYCTVSLLESVTDSKQGSRTTESMCTQAV